MNLRFDVQTHDMRKLYFLRYVSIVFPYLDLARAGNLLLNCLDFRRGVLSPRSLPPLLKIESSLVCNMACPGCLQVKGKERQNLTGQEFLSAANLEKILAPIASRILGVNLTYRGEALMNPEIIQIIRTVKRHQLAAFFPTNLSVSRDRVFFEHLVGTGLDCLSVSLDGTSAASYEKYRRGGDFDLVLRNVRTIADIKRSRNVRRPHLRWKFIVFPHNQHELEFVRNRYRELGFDSYEINYDRDSAPHQEGHRNLCERVLHRKERCFLPWNTMVVGWDGQILPCFAERYPFDLGNAIQSGLSTAWRGRKYRNLRQGLSTLDPRDLHRNCHHCLHGEWPPGKPEIS